MSDTLNGGRSPTPEGGSGYGALLRRSPTALTVHLTSLVVLGAYALWSARGATFVYDDWSFVVPITRGDISVRWLLEPHNEHWVLVPKLVYAGLHLVLGFSSVWPYLGVTLVLHLLLCHLLWRMAVRYGGDPWLATILVAAFAVYAAGVENILWAFQVGLVGNMVLGTLTILELGRSSSRAWLVVVLSLVNVATSGIALVFLALSVVLLLWQRRPHVLWQLLPAAVVYATWYAAFAPDVAEPPASGDDLLLIPLYWVLGIGNALASVVPFRSADQAVIQVFTPVSAVAALFAASLVAIALVALRRHPQLRPDAVVSVFLLGCPLFVLLTSVSRISLGLGIAMASRYAYVGTAFLLPFAVCLLTRVTSVRHVGRRVVLVAAGLLALGNVVAWWPVAHTWTSWSSNGTRVIAAGQQLLRTGAPVYAGATPNVAVAQFNPHDLLLDLPTPIRFGSADRLTASLNMQVRFVPTGEEGQCGPPAAKATVPLPPHGLRVRTFGRTQVTMRMTDAAGHTSHLQAAPVSSGTYVVESLVAGATVDLASVDGTPVIAVCEA